MGGRGGVIALETVAMRTVEEPVEAPEQQSHWVSPIFLSG